MSYVRWIYSVASDSAFDQLGRHGGLQTQVLVEVNVVRAPAVGSPRAFYVDKHKNTIIAGFVLTAILYLLTEILFG